MFQWYLISDFYTSPRETCSPDWGLIFGSLNFQISVGAMELVFESEWIYWCCVLKPAFTEELSLKAYLTDRRYSGAA